MKTQSLVSPFWLVLHHFHEPLRVLVENIMLQIFPTVDIMIKTDKTDAMLVKLWN